jgi:hypothetical protein
VPSIIKEEFLEVIMKKNCVVPLLVAVLCLSWSTVSQAERFDRESYVKSIIAVLQIHAKAIQNLTAHEMKYSDNLVRHSIAIKQTFGLLGPMDWHAAESVRLLKKKNGDPDMNAEKFEKLAKTSQKTMKGLIRSAHENLEEDDREGLAQALNDMKDSCNACHAYLPTSVAPDVWGTLKRR